jgi:hypothetical protein
MPEIVKCPACSRTLPVPDDPWPKSSSKTGPPSETSCKLVHQLARPLRCILTIRFPPFFRLGFSSSSPISASTWHFPIVRLAL